MTTMANNAGGQPMMYYYVAMPNPGTGQQQYVPGGEGMGQATFEGQQVPTFPVGQQPGYGYADQDAATMGGVGMAPMGHMQPAMMPTNAGGNMVPGQMMVLTTMMPQQQQQQPPAAVEQQQDSSQSQGAWGPGMQQPQQPPPHEQQQQPPGPGVPGRSPAHLSKALKIVNPKTQEEIRPKEGLAVEGSTAALPPAGPAAAPAGAAPAPFVVQPLPLPQQPLPQQPQPSSAQPGAVGGGSPSAPPAAGAQPSKRKGLQNKKIEKPTSGDGAPAGAGPAGGSSPTPAAEAEPAKAVAPAPAAPAATAAAAAPAASEAPASRRTEAGTGGGASLPRWPLAGMGGGGGQSSTFASSIKALNLEPMRANPQPFRGKPGILRLQGSGEGHAQQPAQPPAQPQQQQPPPQPVAQPAPQPQPTFQPVPLVPSPQPMAQGGASPQPGLGPGMAPPQPMMPLLMPQALQPQALPPQAQAQAAASPTPAAPAPQKKGIKLKNAAMARPQKPRAEEDGAERPDGERSPVPPAADEPPKENTVAAVEPSAPRHQAPEAIAAVPTPMLSLRPPDGIFDRTLMLRIWRSKKDDVHPALPGLHTNARPGEKPTTADRKRRGREGGVHEPTDRAQVFGTDMKTSKGSKGGSKELQAVMKVSEKGYRIQEASGPLRREDEIERRVRSLLNKICPENLKTIVERLALIELFKAEELEFVIRIIFAKALAEPHYCETYADMVFALRTRYPEFPAEQEGEKATTFTRVLLNTCQNEFESLPSTFEPTEEERRLHSADDLRLEMKKRKDKMLANMKFIGNLFLRQLLAVKVIGQVVHDLVGIKEAPPEEHMIECVCELLRSIGFTLDGTSHGKVLMSQFSARLQDLKRTAGPDGRVLYSKRIQFGIQDLLDLRNNGWQEKLFRDQAKTKQEIRMDAVKEAKQASKGGPEVLFATQVAGMRPAYIDDTKNPRPGRAKPESDKKQAFDQAYVKRLFQYYAEERNVEGLEADWSRPQPTPKEATQGVTWLLEIGFYDAQKEDIVAETIEKLVTRRVVPWELLRDALQPQLENLEDMRIDVPTADVFVHSLLSRLLAAAGRGFNATVLRPLGPLCSEDQGCQFVWGLLRGALRRLRDHRGGTDAVRRAIEIPEFADVLCKARRCPASELKRHLQEEGLL